ncbi:MAG: glucosamine kinase [Cyclobacteriaceae bacterium]|jgi:glucosamine kinase
MILIAEAGSTKTDWRIISQDGVKKQASGGFNPVVNFDSVYLTQIESQFMEIKAKVQKVFFYSAGINQDLDFSAVVSELKKIFSNAKIEIASDLLAAGRSLYGSDTGMIGILGTGAALGRYENHQMVYRVPSLGYILGDEGSGFYLGKELIKRVLRDQVPKELKEAFLFKYPEFNERKILNTIYGGSRPNKVIASYCEFLSHHQNHPYFNHLIYKAFMHFFDSFHNHFIHEKELKWRFVGSVAFYFEEILKKAGSEYDLYIDQVIQAPIDALTLYHQQNG